jgi:hypothetical protein
VEAFADDAKLLEAAHRHHLKCIVSKRKTSPNRSGESLDSCGRFLAACPEYPGRGVDNRKRPRRRTEGAAQTAAKNGDGSG